MNARLIRTPLYALAALGLSAAIALSQQTPPAPPPTTTAPAAAPIERQPPQPGMRPGMNPGMRQGMRPGGRPEMMQGNMRPGMQQRFQGSHRMHGHGGPGGGFRGHEQEGGGFHIGPAGMWWKNPMVVQRLTLTPEQTKKMDGIFQESRLQLIDLKANVEKQQVMLEPLLSANPVDTKAAMIQIDKVAQARADLEKANAKMLLGIRATLTADQWTKLRSHGEGQGGQGGPGTPGAQGGPGGPGGGQGRGRGMRPGGGAPGGGAPGSGAPGTSNFVEPIQ
jgi:Spy/CpxP family protein refolding chaperone